MANDHKILLTRNTHDTSLLVQRAALQASDIACYVHHETSGSSYPLMFPRARLILVNAEDLAAAQRVLADLAEAQADPAPAGTWECEKCGETCETTFTSCWKCGADRDDW